MADNKNLNNFRNSNGSTSEAGQKNAGDWERKTYGSDKQSGQQSWESWEAYQKRING